MSNSAVDLGKMLGNLSNRVATLEGNVYPDDPSAQLQLLISETLTLSESGVITFKLYPTNSFIVDHPVYGNVNSSVLLIDGGYASSTVNQTF